MAFKQPRVPEYRAGDGVASFLRALVLFLKDFCQEAWVEHRQLAKTQDELKKRMDALEGK